MTERAIHLEAVGSWVIPPLCALFVCALVGCQPDVGDLADTAPVDPPIDAEVPCADGAQRPCDLDGECVGIAVCANGRFGRCMPPPETCNGLDDDCDDVIDEAFPDLGDSCTLGEGACQAEGISVCNPETGFTVCDALPTEPTDELCNGLDDDCDGATDERITPQPCDEGVGACRAEGQRFCVGGEMVCDIEPGLPGVEACNGIDDDCDGTTDEDPSDEGRPCGTGLEGICAPGRLTCEGGQSLCIGETDAVDEVCNGLDDDCDGAEDEGFDVGLPCAVGRGACLAAGTTICDADGQAVCDAMPRMPAAEVCNAEDDDCDGLVDEGIGAPETCNGRDDDCDFEIDEGYDVGAECDVGVGTCARTGHTICNRLGEAECSVTAGEPRDELCDEADDDCDGEIDEDLGIAAPCEVGLGACAAIGQGLCGENGALFCFADASEPTPERCDDIDNDCDGRTDENFQAGAPCESGVGACRAEGVRRCTADGVGALCDAVEGEPAEETCNGLDDDCDGRTDEGFPIGGACELGRGQCADRGVFICDDTEDSGVACDAVPGDPEDERCDGDDNDCDGRTDEGLGLGRACPVGVGACERQGLAVCGDAGETVCLGDPGPSGDETCNDIDDDCDGFTDEDFAVGEGCEVGRGACLREGALACDADGGLACGATAGAPGSEICNGEDDDCDGEIDEVVDCEVHRSCAAALAAGAEANGTYLVSDNNGEVRSIYCDQQADGGGWTLVSASRGAPPHDKREPWSPDLQGPEPAGAHLGIWPGLRSLSLRHDVRFVCHADPAGPPTVDISFYGVSWYREFTTGTDADCCFSENDGRGASAEASVRRDNRTGHVRAKGQGRLHDEGDWFEGEDSCEAADDFAIDFDGRALSGLDDPTDWGLFDGIPRCGTDPVGARSRWLIYARPPVAAPLGTIGIIGPTALPFALTGSGFGVEVLDPSPAMEFGDFAAVFIGRFGGIWDALPPDFEAMLDAFSRAGGGIITEFDGAALLAEGYDDDFIFDAGAPDPWGWLPMQIGAGGFLGLSGLDRAPEALEDPALRSLPDTITGLGGPAFFVRPTLAEQAAIKVLTTTSGDDGAFGDGFVSTFRAVRCGANLLVGVGSYDDAAREGDIEQYIRNLAAVAVSPAPPADVLADLCPD